jgi:hypothetical protein
MYQIIMFLHKYPQFFLHQINKNKRREEWKVDDLVTNPQTVEQLHNDQKSVTHNEIAMI